MEIETDGTLYSVDVGAKIRIRSHTHSMEIRQIGDAGRQLFPAGHGSALYQQWNDSGVLAQSDLDLDASKVRGVVLTLLEDTEPVLPNDDQHDSLLGDGILQFGRKPL